MSFVQVPPDSTGKKIATIENGSGEQVQIIAIDSTTTKTIGEQITSSDVGLVTNTVIHGKSTAGGGSYVDVKVNPSGALVADVTGSDVTVAGVAQETTLTAILSLQDQVKSLADGIQYLANVIAVGLPRLDAANRQVVNVESGTVGVSGALTSVAAVTTVSTVTNLATIGGVNPIYAYQDVPTTIYDNIKVT